MLSQVTVKRPRVDVSALRRRRGLSREWKVLLLSSLAVFMVFLDVTIVNIAFPAIRRTFTGTSLSDLSWVLNGYNVVVAALLVPAGRIADRVGRRRVFFIGLALFLLGSVISGSASTADMLIAARVVQALGGAALIPASLGLVLEEVPAERRAMATSLWAATGAVAAATGPSLGGVLVETTSWRWAFFVNLVIAIGMLPAPRLLRETRASDSNGAPDLLGAAMLVVSVGALALGIVKAPDWGWTSDRVLAAWSIAAGVRGRLRRSIGSPSGPCARAGDSADPNVQHSKRGVLPVLDRLLRAAAREHPVPDPGMAVLALAGGIRSHPCGADGRDCGRRRRAAGRAVRIPPGGRAGVDAVLRRVPRLPRRRAAAGLSRSLATGPAHLGQRGRVDIRGTDERLRR